MTLYRVEMECDAREVYIVEAETPELAAEHWDDGDRILTEVSAGTVVKVTEDGAR